MFVDRSGLAELPSTSRLEIGTTSKLSLSYRPKLSGGLAAECSRLEAGAVVDAVERMAKSGWSLGRRADRPAVNYWPVPPLGVSSPALASARPRSTLADSSEVRGSSTSAALAVALRNGSSTSHPKGRSAFGTALSDRRLTTALSISCSRVASPRCLVCKPSTTATRKVPKQSAFSFTVSPPRFGLLLCSKFGDSMPFRTTIRLLPFPIAHRSRVNSVSYAATTAVSCFASCTAGQRPSSYCYISLRRRPGRSLNKISRLQGLAGTTSRHGSIQLPSDPPPRRPRCPVRWCFVSRIATISP
jgi:hypothetical protein